jgi:hypothetical protein
VFGLYETGIYISININTYIIYKYIIYIHVYKKGEDIDLWLSNSLKIIEQEKVEINVLVEKNGEKIGDNQLIERYLFI